MDIENIEAHEYLTDVRTLNVLPMDCYLDFKYILFWPTMSTKSVSKYL